MRVLCLATICSLGSLTACGGSQIAQAPWQGQAQQQQRAAKEYTVVHEFGVEPNDGKNSSSELIDVNGTLYGTTVGGGSAIYGTVFKVDPSGTESVLHNFGGPNDGVNPYAALLNVDGTLYGTTANGGKNSGGTVFRITPDGKEKVIHDFASGRSSDRNSGSTPVAGLINVNGTLYGTTERGGEPWCGGEFSCGTVFSITTSGKYKVLHRFGLYDGSWPAAALVNVDGTLYGTTIYGGTYDRGTVFSISPAGDERIIYSFGQNLNAGGYPAAPLLNVDCMLYGTAPGDQGGTIFSMTTDGTEKNLHVFGGKDGSKPLAGLIDVNGIFYGTTEVGGVYNVGTVFSITTDGEESVIHSFHAGSGKSPRASLLSVGRTLYGTTWGSIDETHGNIFSLKP